MCNSDYDPTIGRWTTKDPIGFAGGDTNLYAYVGNDPVTGIDPTGMSRLVFNVTRGTITVISGSGQTVAIFPAANNVASTAPAGNVPEGTFNYLYHTSHPESSANGPYGSNGNFVFNFPNGSGIGVHSGRSGPQYRTNGCIRSTDAATSLINNLNSTDPLTSITVDH